jgi:TPR repeat protein
MRCTGRRAWPQEATSPQPPPGSGRGQCGFHAATARRRPLTPAPLRPSPRFEDTLANAQAGDVKEQALLSQMYKEGYGTEPDAAAAARWAERARQRGYKMRGVYCQL